MQPQFITLPARAKDITGQRFDRLVVLGPIGRGRSPKRKIIWLCQCDCGNTTKIMEAYTLRSGHIRSCGCLHAEIMSKIARRHGYHAHPLYGTWKQMLDRCHNPKARRYRNYGARGIQVCAEWRNSIKAFIDYMRQLPHYGVSGYTIDRIDNDSDYMPGNVRWATQPEQQRNRQQTRNYTYEGKTQCLTDWADEYGISRRTLVHRLARGVSFEQALMTPPHRGRPD